MKDAQQFVNEMQDFGLTREQAHTIRHKVIQKTYILSAKEGDGMKYTVDKSKINHYKTECNPAKERLIEMMHNLYSIGANKEAEQLEKIIIRLEVWQNK